MSSRSDKALSPDVLRQCLADTDAELHAALIERGRLGAALRPLEEQQGAGVLQPGQEADLMRRLVERHEGPLSLATLEHIWRMLLSERASETDLLEVHLDGSADLLEMLDLARFHFGFACELVPGADAADVVASVAASSEAVGLIALQDRAELPWWRGLSLQGAEVIARLPFLVQESRPADLPSLVIAPASAIALKAGRDTIVYDARWSGMLPGSLMMQGLEVVSFHRSMNGIDALLAVSADLSEDQILAACVSAGAAPDVLRMVGGYSSPIDVEGDAEEDFDTAAAEG